MWKWVEKLLRGNAHPHSASPRMPNDRQEGIDVYRRWDALNGRYYYRADVRFVDGTVCRGVLFDGTSNIAVVLQGDVAGEQEQFLAKPIAEIIITEDRSPGRP